MEIKGIDYKPILLILLTFKIVGQVYVFFSSSDYMMLLLAGCYFIAMVGIAKRQIWGSILSGIFALVDLVSSLVFLGETFAIGAVVFDAIVLFFSWKEYGRVKPKKRHL